MSSTQQTDVVLTPSHPADPLLGEIETFIREAIEGWRIEQPALPQRGRPTVLPALWLWSGLIVCVLRGFSSQLALWRLLTQTGLWHYPRLPLSDQAIYHRLARDGVAPMQQCFAQFSALLAARLDPWLAHLGPDPAPFATAIVAVDETTLDQVARRLPGPDERLPDTRRLPGKLAGVFDLRRQQWCTIRWIEEARQNEKVAAREVLAGLAPGTLILADLGYFGFRWFDDLTTQGYWWVSRLRAGTSYEIVHVFAQHGDTLDAVIWLGAYRADRARHLVRLTQYRHGAELRRYITNVRDPDTLTLEQIAQLYARRWDIEMAVQLIKQQLGVALLWSTKAVVIQQQLYAVLIIAQILQALRLEIAARAGVAIFDVSLPLLVQYLPQFAARGDDPVTAFVERGRAAGFIRPSRRIQIHARDPPVAAAVPIANSLPFLRIPRYAAKQ